MPEIKAKRSRMTAQSKSNIEAATAADLLPATGGYHVRLKGKNNGTAFVENAEGPILYSRMATAKKAVKQHNNKLNPSLAPTI